MRVGYAGKTVSLPMAAALATVMGAELAHTMVSWNAPKPPPWTRHPPWPVGGGGKWRRGQGKPGPHILPDGTVRVKGFKPKGLAGMKFKPGCNYPGSKYERNA